MKRVALSMLAVTLICASSLQSRNPMNMVWKSNPWGFVEDEFIIKPERRINTILARIKRIGAGALIGGGAGYGAHKGVEVLENWHKFFKEGLVKGIGVTCAAAIGGTIGFKVVKYYTKKDVDLNALKEFIREWQDNKAYTPKDLHEFCDALSEEYKSHGKVGLQRFMPDIMRKIRRVIWGHFPNKYDHKLKAEDADFFDAKFFFANFNIDVGTILSGIAHIISAVGNKGSTAKANTQ